MDGHWEEFAPEANEKMLQAYLDYVREIPGTQFVTISSGGVDRQEDFKLMQQKHLRTKKKTRGIRALPGAPPNWESSKKKCCWSTFHQPFPVITHAAAEPKKNLTGAKIKI